MENFPSPPTTSQQHQQHQFQLNFHSGSPSKLTKTRTHQNLKQIENHLADRIDPTTGTEEIMMVSPKGLSYAAGRGSMGF